MLSFLFFWLFVLDAWLSLISPISVLNLSDTLFIFILMFVFIHYKWSFSEDFFRQELRIVSLWWEVLPLLTYHWMNWSVKPSLKLIHFSTTFEYVTWYRFQVFILFMTQLLATYLTALNGLGTSLLFALH